MPEICFNGDHALDWPTKAATERHMQDILGGMLVDELKVEPSQE